MFLLNHSLIRNCSNSIECHNKKNYYDLEIPILGNDDDIKDKATKQVYYELQRINNNHSILSFLFKRKGSTGLKMLKMQCTTTTHHFRQKPAKFLLRGSGQFLRGLKTDPACCVEAKNNVWATSNDFRFFPKKHELDKVAMRH